MMYDQISDADLAKFKKEAEAYRKRHTRSQQAARKELVALGIVTPKGNLRKVYGG
jgi:hypothetical protein